MPKLEAELHIRLAPMCGGKTDYLLTQISRFLLKYKCLYINHLKDTRTETSFSTHSTIEKKLPKDVMTVKTNDFKTFFVHNLIESVNIEIENYDAIFIDEGNFYGPELIDFVKCLVDTLEKYVIVVGLDGDYKREKLGYILDLIPLCDTVEKFKALCEDCGQDNAVTSYRIVESTEKFLVGGKEAYKPLCRKCYLQQKKI